MATLTLTKLWVNLVATGQAASGDAAVGRPEDYSAPGRVSIYAGGRVRSITSIGELGAYRFQLRYVPRSTVDLLHTWLRQVVQVRDSKGRKVFGVYFDMSVDEVSADHFCRSDINLYSGAWHVGIELQLVTVTEGV